MDLSPIIEQLAKKHKLPKGAVEAIAHLQFSYVRSVITAGNQENILLRNLGKVAIKPNRLKLEKEIKRVKQLINEQKAQDDIRRVEEHIVPKSGDRANGESESGDMQHVQKESI